MARLDPGVPVGFGLEVAQDRERADGPGLSSRLPADLLPLPVRQVVSRLRHHLRHDHRRRRRDGGSGDGCGDHGRAHRPYRRRDRPTGEHPLNAELLVQRVKEIYELQKNVVIVCGEGIVDEQGEELGAAERSTDPAGNLVLTGASEALREILIEGIGDEYFRTSCAATIRPRKPSSPESSATPSAGGRPLLFDRFHAAQLGGQAVEMLLHGQNNCVSTLQWSEKRGFYVDSINGHQLPRPLGAHSPAVHAPLVLRPAPDAALADRHGRLAADLQQRHRPRRCGEHGPDAVRPGQSVLGPYHSVNTDVNKRICYLDPN